MLQGSREKSVCTMPHDSGHILSTKIKWKPVSPVLSKVKCGYSLRIRGLLFNQVVQVVFLCSFTTGDEISPSGSEPPSRLTSCQLRRMLVSTVSVKHNCWGCMRRGFTTGDLTPVPCLLVATAKRPSILDIPSTKLGVTPIGCCSFT